MKGCKQQPNQDVLSSTKTGSTASISGTKSQELSERERVLQVLDYKLKNDEAILFEVGKLGKDYQEWIRKTRVPNPARFFDTEWLEACSHCPWWTVPLVWTPVVCYLLYSSPLGASFTAMFYGIGFLAWPSHEYVLHRYLFHVKTDSYAGNTLHWFLHGNHHLCPNDELRLVLPPIPAAVFALFFRFLAQRMFGADAGDVYMAGLITGYMVYDLTHYALHSNALKEYGMEKGSWFHRLRMHHLRHHKALHSEFGITNIFIDVLLGTTSPPN